MARKIRELLRNLKAAASELFREAKDRTESSCILVIVAPLP